LKIAIIAEALLQYYVAQGKISTDSSECGAYEPYSVTCGGNNFNECPDDHPTKFRVFTA